MNTINETPHTSTHLPKSCPQETREAFMQFLKEWPGELEPKTPKDLLIYILQANSDTQYIHKKINSFEGTGDFKQFLIDIKEPLVRSVKSATNFEETIKKIDTLITEKIIPLDFYQKIQNFFLKDSQLRDSVKRFLTERNLKDGVLVYLIFLIQSFIELEISIEEGQGLKYFLGFTAKDKFGIDHKPGKRQIFQVFIFFNKEKPSKDVEKYFYLEIPRKGTANSNMKILGRFWSLIDDYHKDHLLLPPYTEFIIEKVEKKNRVKVIHLRFAAENDIKNLKEEHPENKPLKTKQGLRIFGDCEVNLL